MQKAQIACIIRDTFTGVLFVVLMWWTFADEFAKAMTVIVVVGFVWFYFVNGMERVYRIWAIRMFCREKSFDWIVAKLNSKKFWDRHLGVLILTAAAGDRYGGDVFGFDNEEETIVLWKAWLARTRGRLEWNPLVQRFVEMESTVHTPDGGVAEVDQRGPPDQ